MGALLAFLNSTTQLMMADLYTFTTVGGTVYRFCGGDRVQSVNGRSFVLGPKIERSTIRSVVGIEVDTLRVDLHAEPSVMLGALPMIQALAQGLMDNGTLGLERLFMDGSGAPKGAVLLFMGRVGQITTTRGHATLEVVSHTELLDVMIPTGVYQPACRNTLYDLNCGASKASFGVSNTVSVASGPTRQSFSSTFSGVAAINMRDCTLGTVTFSTGANAGITRTVKRQVAGTPTAIEVVYPWPYPVAVGDAFTIYQGCDKTKTTCQGVFNNLGNFAGEPFIPLPETVV